MCHPTRQTAHAMSLKANSTLWQPKKSKPARLAPLDSLVVGYPTIPWLAIMMLGWACGRFLIVARLRSPERLFFRTGISALTLFIAVRGANGYGNMGLMHEGAHGCNGCT